MLTDLDRKYDEILAEVTGPGGRVVIGRDGEGRAIVTNLPATLPVLFDAFSILHGATEAVVAGTERIAFAELDTLATRLAHALAGGWNVAKGDRVAIAMRNCPAWILCYMAVLKAGGIATLINGWWQAEEMRHALAHDQVIHLLRAHPAQAHMRAAVQRQGPRKAPAIAVEHR